MSLFRGMRQELPPDPKEFMVEMQDVCSEEVYETADGSRRPVLSGNSLTVRRGECWGIIGDERFESELLLEIIGCVRSYRSGVCRLVERGMMRRKRRILPHVFFVGDPESTIPDMTTLAYLLYATDSTGQPPRERQIAILEMLLAGGLYDCALTPLKHLSKARQSVIALMAAYFSKAILILYSAVAYDFDSAERSMLRYLADRMRSEGRSLVMAASDCAAVQAVCTHAAFLVGGTIRRQGTVPALTEALDHRLFMVRSDSAAALTAALAPLIPGCRLHRQGAWVEVDRGEKSLEQAECLDALKRCGVPFDVYRVSEPTLTNAFLEVMSQDAQSHG